MHTLIPPGKCGFKFELDQRNRRRQAIHTSGVFAVQMHLAQSQKVPALARGDPGSNPPKIAVVCQEDRVVILRDLGDEWIGRILKNLFLQTNDGVTPRLKKLAGILRHIVIREKSQLGGGVQAARSIFRRTVATSKTSSEGYCFTIPASSYPARTKL